VSANANPFGRLVPELPVADVVRAQQHYRDVLGFTVGWLEADGEMGAVSRDDTVLFLRRKPAPFEPAIHWVFAADLDGLYQDLKARGAAIAAAPEKKPWGLRQFTLSYADANLFYFHD
jgi:uncharacterized glyoxalase superfamily protein PhnB